MSSPGISTNVRSDTPWLVRSSLRTLSAVAPPVAAAVAEQLFFTPPRHAAPAHEREALRGARMALVRTDDGDVATWTWGHGPAVLLLHGWGGRASQLAPFAPALVARGLSVVAIDAPGHGASSGRLSSVPEFARALRVVAEACPSPLRAVIAHSFGGPATNLALRDGLPADRVAYVGAPADVLAWPRAFAAAAGLNEATLAAMRARFEARWGRRWEEVDLLPALPEMRARLLVVHDLEDRDVPYRESTRYLDAWPGAERMTTEGLGHRRLLRDRTVIDRVAAFVAG